MAAEVAVFVAQPKSTPQPIDDARPRVRAPDHIFRVRQMITNV
jgi:hypothetical protein